MNKTLFICILIYLFSTYISAISYNTAVTGKISSTDGTSISGVKIIASSFKMSNKKIVVSNKKGSYRILNLIPGSYMISFQKEGFKTIIYTNILVNRVKKNKIHITMSIKDPNHDNIIKDELSLIEVKRISPYSEGSIKKNQKVFIWLSYRLPDNYTDGVLIWVIPDAVKHAEVQFSPLIKSKTGSVSRYFFIKKGNVKIKKIRVRIMDRNKTDILFQKTIKVNLNVAETP